MPELVTTDRNGILSLATLKTKLAKQVNDIRYSKVYQASIPYTFPGDTEPDGIQMRDEVDRQNIQDIIMDAILKDPADTMYFMPTSNNMKTLTAQDLIDMGRFMKARGDQIVAYAWGLKTQIRAAPDVANLPDIEEGWPV